MVVAQQLAKGTHSYQSFVTDRRCRSNILAVLVAKEEGTGPHIAGPNGYRKYHPGEQRDIQAKIDRSKLREAKGVPTFLLKKKGVC